MEGNLSSSGLTFPTSWPRALGWRWGPQARPLGSCDLSALMLKRGKNLLQYFMQIGGGGVLESI